jgi:hypothetical protein
MNFIKDTLDYLTRIFQWWVIIMPWEMAIRVRLGKKIKILSAGTYFRIPFVDTIFLQSTRLRVVQMAPQTIATRDGKTLTIVVCAGYSISNIETLYQRMFQAESTISNIIMGEIAKHVSSNDLGESTPEKLEQKVMTALNADDYGVKYEYVKVIGYAIVKTFRLIQDSHWTADGLSTNTKHN